MWIFKVSFQSKLSKWKMILFWSLYVSLDPMPPTESASIFNIPVITLALGASLGIAVIIIFLLVILLIVRTKQLKAKQTK